MERLLALWKQLEAHTVRCVQLAQVCRFFLPSSRRTSVPLLPTATNLHTVRWWLAGTLVLLLSRNYLYLPTVRTSHHNKPKPLDMLFFLSVFSAEIPAPSRIVESCSGLLSTPIPPPPQQHASASAKGARKALARGVSTAWLDALTELLAERHRKRQGWAAWWGLQPSTRQPATQMRYAWSWSCKLCAWSFVPAYLWHNLCACRR